MYVHVVCGKRVRGEAARYGESPFGLIACALTEMD